MLEKKLVTKNYHLIYPIFLILFLIGGLFFTLSQSQKPQDLSSHAAGITNCTVSSANLTVKSQEQQLLNDINTYRTQNALQQLTMNTTLKQSAAWQSADMLAHNNLSHTDSLGRTPDIRLENCGYDITEGYGESIADGTTNADSVFTSWRNDPSHNQILLTARFDIAGIDLETSGTKAFWTMDFGTTAPATPTLQPTQTQGNSTPTPTATGQQSPSGSPTTISNSPSEAPSNAPNPSISPTQGPVTNDMLLSVSVQIYGIGQGGNPSPKHLTRKITAFVYGIKPDPVAVGNAFLVYDGTNYFTGTIHLGKMSQGSYFVKLVGNNTLQVLAKPEFQTLLIGRTNVIPPVTLYQGDLDGNNVLDINDYNLALACFQDKRCANASSIDFNDDGVTDVKDYNLMLQSFEMLHGN